MKVTLKRAHFYDKAAQEHARAMLSRVQTHVNLSVYAAESQSTAQIQAEVDKAAQVFATEHALALALYAAAYTIREQVAVANVEHGISALLAEVNRTEKEKALLASTIKQIEAARTGLTTAYSAFAKAEAARSEKGDRYLGGRDETVKVAVVDEAGLTGLKRDLKRLTGVLAGLNDQLTAANVQNSITLNDTTVAALREAELLVED